MKKERRVKRERERERERKRERERERQREKRKNETEWKKGRVKGIESVSVGEKRKRKNMICG